MAGNSGSFRVRFHPSYATSGSGYYLTIDWSQSDPFSEQAIRTNTTTLTATMYVGGKGSGYHINASAKNNHKIIVNSVSKTGTSAVGFSSENNYTARTLMSASFPITHNTNGTATAVIRGQANINISTSSGKIGTAYIPGSGSGNTKSLTLATIPRPSTTSISQSSTVEIGNTIIFNINKNLNELTHTLLYSFDKTTWKTIASNITDTTLSWDLSESLAENFPNTTSTLIHFRTDTYLNNNNSLQKIGSEQFSTTLSLKREVGKPKLSELTVNHTFPKIDQTNNKLEKYLILNKSQVSASVKSKLYGGATIKYFVYNINGSTYNISPSEENLTNGLYSFLLKDNIGSIAKDLELKISVYAIDSRGFQSEPIEPTDKFPVLSYYTPTISSIKMIRGHMVFIQEDGIQKRVFEEYPGGRTIKLNFMYDIDPITIIKEGEEKETLNSKFLSFKYSINNSGISETNTITLTDFKSDIKTGYDYLPAAQLNATFPEEIDTNNQYKIYLTIQDALSSSTEILAIRSQGILLNFGANGTSAAIGGKAENSNFTIFYPTLFHEGIEYKELITDGSEASSDLNDLTSGWYSFRSSPSDANYNFPFTHKEVEDLGLIDKGVIQVSGLSSSSIEWQIQKISYLSKEGEIISFSRSYSGTWSNWVEGANAASEIDIEKIVIPSDTADGFIPIAQNGKLVMDSIKLNQISVENEDDTIPVVDTGKLVPKDADSVFELFKDSLDSYMSNYILEKFYPVGSIYISANSTSPSTLFGGTWTQITGKYLLANNTSGNTGGNSKDYITASSHQHLSPAGYNHYDGNNYFGVSYKQGEETIEFNGAYSTALQKFTRGSGKFTWTLPKTSSAGETKITISSADILSIAPAYQVYVWKRTA